MRASILRILHSAEGNIGDKITATLDYLQQNCSGNSKLDVLKDIVGSSDNISELPAGILYHRKPIGVLLYEDVNKLSPENASQYYCIHLSNENFILCLKEIIFYILLHEDDSTNYSPRKYRELYKAIDNSFNAYSWNFAE